jgi:hypothetical protein
MTRSPANHPIALCPTNGRPGRVVDSLTLKALLAVPLTKLTTGEYFFCPAADCPTVYYRVDGGQHFDEADLREAVFQKHPGDEASLVCYCFRHTVGSIQLELAQTGASTVVEQITAGIRAGQCACDIRNPQGDCCLGNVRRLVQQTRSEMGL